MANKKTIEKIIEIYEKSSKVEDCMLGSGLPLNIVNFKTSTYDINAFCEIVSEIREEGYETYLVRYLTALIQRCDSKKIILNLPIALNITPLNDFGYMLKDKKIIVNGNLGNIGFLYARDCSAEIDGNVGDYFAHIAEGCSFKVKGNVGKEPLRYARNCELKFQK